MFGEILLAVWSAAAIAWWLLAWILVATEQRRKTPIREPSERRFLSVFKPLPPLDAHGFETMAPGLESFLAQLDDHSEMLLGVHEQDRATITPFLDGMKIKYPAAKVCTVFRSEPDTVPNPKIAWQIILARHAKGELWLWSDADIIAPAHFLRAARSEYETCGAALLTFPYVVRAIPSPPAILDAVFVNAEFFPGALLLRRFGPVDFAFGAGMLFEREVFLHKIEWQEIGAELADDFFIGQKLKPVRIGTTVLTTVADADTWAAARAHDLRWSKTIRWNRPGGFAARLAILPLLGWVGAMMLHPLHGSVWLGLLTMMQIEVFFAARLCHSLGCRFRVRDLLAMELWSIWRIFVWLICWLPGSVDWSGKSWNETRMNITVKSG